MKRTAEGDAAKLMNAIPSIDWNQIATKSDLDNTTTTIKADIHNMTSVLRAEIDVGSANLRTEIAHSLRINNLALIGSFTAIASVLVVVVPLLR